MKTSSAVLSVVFNSNMAAASSFHSHPFSISRACPCFPLVLSSAVTACRKHEFPSGTVRIKRFNWPGRLTVLVILVIFDQGPSKAEKKPPKTKRWSRIAWIETLLRKNKVWLWAWGDLVIQLCYYYTHIKWLNISTSDNVWFVDKISFNFQDAWWSCNQDWWAVTRVTIICF